MRAIDVIERGRRTDTISEPERARGLHAAPDVLDARLLAVRALQAGVDVPEVLGGEDLEGGDDAPAGEVVDGLDGARLGDLHLQRAFAEAELEHLGDVLVHLGLEDHVLAGDARVDVTLADEGGDVGRGEEDAAGGGEGSTW